ncbi:MAG TPA: nitrogenase iron-molybdenum protein, beta chain [Firmicutes bacterium]|jgi:nitrogenase molybdenum-iron protein beta chain|nr:nitrogenase iron-molybdenum protein, beta chain [Bacillota bacterium]
MNRISVQPRNFCALGGQQTVLGISKAIPIVHSGSACCLRLFQGMSFCNGYQGTGYGGGNAIPNNNIHRPDLIYGAEKRLRDLIAGTLKVMEADLYVVLTGCNVGLIGDDVAAVVGEFQKGGVPIVYAETSGYKGSAYLGHELVTKALVEQFVLRKREVEPGLINLWVSMPYADPFWNGNYEVLQQMLSEIGLQVNVLFGPGSKAANWKKVASAEFNLLVSPWVGLETVLLLQRKFETPYLHYPVLPIGARECRRFLQRVSEFALLDMERVSRYIERQEGKFYYYMERILDLLTRFDNSFPKRFFIISDAAYTLGFSSFLTQGLGFTPGFQYVVDDPPCKHRAEILQFFNQIAPGLGARVEFSAEPADIPERIGNQVGGDIPLVLGSAWDAGFTKRLKGSFLEVSAPVSDRLILDRSYVGYRGGLLAEDIYSAIINAP